MSESSQKLVFPYKINWKSFVPVVLLLLATLAICWAFAARGYSVLLPALAALLLGGLLVSAFTRVGKPFFVFEKDTLYCPLLPRELNCRIRYADLEAARIDSPKNRHLCLKLRDPDDALEPLPPKRRLYYRHSDGRQEWDLYLSIGGLAGEAQEIFRQLEARLSASEAPGE